MSLKYLVYCLSFLVLILVFFLMFKLIFFFCNLVLLSILFILGLFEVFGIKFNVLINCLVCFCGNCEFVGELECI